MVSDHPESLGRQQIVTVRMKHARWMHRRLALLGLGATMGAAVMACCSPGDSLPEGGRVEHPVRVVPLSAPPPLPTLPLPASESVTPRPLPTPSPRASSSSLPAPEASAQEWLTSLEAPSAPDPKPLPSEVLAHELRLKLSPHEMAIVDDCPERRWSKNVPDRACTKGDAKDGTCGGWPCEEVRCAVTCTNDSQCGDGFCDRGKCSAIWTCGRQYGLRCETDAQCGGLCIKGRCRSCVSDAECVKRLGRSDGVCGHEALDALTDSRFCFGENDVVPSIPGAPVRSSPSPKSRSP